MHQVDGMLNTRSQAHAHGYARRIVKCGALLDALGDKVVLPSSLGPAYGRPPADLTLVIIGAPALVEPAVPLHHPYVRQCECVAHGCTSTRRACVLPCTGMAHFAVFINGASALSERRTTTRGVYASQSPCACVSRAACMRLTWDVHVS
jgi:hypothetical protein